MKTDGDQPTLPPLMEVPTPDEFASAGKIRAGPWSSVKNWIKEQIETMSHPLPGYVKRSDVQLLLGVLGSPLVPVPVSKTAFHDFSIKNKPLEASSAQYIVQQFIAATGALKLQSNVRNIYSMGKVKMVASEFESASKVIRTRHPSKAAEAGCFVLWQMMPDLWCVELALAGSKVRAGSNGHVVWRQDPWLGSHKVKGHVRPLRRVLQGLDPWTTANLFSNAHCVGEKIIRGDPCFVLKLVADPVALSARSDGPAEIIRHVMFGYFSQKTGLLVQLEDSHLLRIQAIGRDTIYWETSLETCLEDYRSVDGVTVAHEGRTISTLFRFGETAMSHTRTRMEETWTIEEVAFNVPGVSIENFMPPGDMPDFSISEAGELTIQGGKTLIVNGRSRVAAVEKPIERMNDLIWRSDARDFSTSNKNLSL
eukprot:c9595_g2_i1 orf=435-1703(-)